MKPLSDRRKAWARAYLVQGPLRLVAKPLFHAALAVEERWFAATGAPARPLPPALVTAVIKTFQRPRRCAALIASIRRHYPNLSIVVVDDSRSPGDYPGCRHVRLPFDSGLSAGRNAGIAAVETEYLLNLDDDFLFYSKTALGEALAILEQHREIDLLAGIVVDLPLLITHDFRDAGLFPTSAEARISPGTRIGPAVVMDKVPNFFLARTAAVRSVGWDPALKMIEHADFFTRARGRIVSAQWDGWRILHRRDPFDRDYLEFRQDLASSRAHLERKYGRGRRS
jgi:glycosyltransferase involved in cell wall biosynthesis